MVSAIKKVGKKIGNTLYLHVSAIPTLAISEIMLISQAERCLPSLFPYNIVKLNVKNQEVSFIFSPDWDTSPEPRVGDSAKVHVTTQSCTFTKARTQNHQIYHHKWMFVSPDYQGFDIEASKCRSRQWEQIVNDRQLDRKKIGNSDYWTKEVLPFLLDGQQSWVMDIPIPTSTNWQRGVNWNEAITKQSSLFNGTMVCDAEDYSPHPTQVRNTVLTYQKIFDYLSSTHSSESLLILDASSGMGLGTAEGRMRGFEIEDVEIYPPLGYQPMYRSYEAIKKKYDVILCLMVLNIIPQDLRDKLVRTLARLLHFKGRIYFLVREQKEIERQPSGIPFQPIGDSRLDQNGEYFFPSKRSFQKGFTKQELVSYLQDVLLHSDMNFHVEVLNKGNSGVPNGVGAIVIRQ